MVATENGIRTALYVTIDHLNFDRHTMYVCHSRIKDRPDVLALCKYQNNRDHVHERL
jgi:hypothetical protein